MFQIQVNARDGSSGGGCDVCCCAPLSAKPGEVNRVQIDYAPWSLPLGGRGLTCNTTFLTEKVKTCGDVGLVNSPIVNPFYGLTPNNTPFVGTLATVAVDPNSDPLTYKHLALYGPYHGTLSVSVDGSFVYTPSSGFSGYDSFFFSVGDGNCPPVVQEAIIAVSPALPLPPLTLPTANRLTPVVGIDKQAVSVNSANHFLQFPLSVSPIAAPGDLYRLTVRQGAMTCDGFCYFHESCYDISISKC